MERGGEQKLVFSVLNSVLPRLSLKSTAKELALLVRLLYRGKNQHRRDTSYQKLTKVVRDMKKCLRADVFSSIQRLSRDSRDPSCSHRITQQLFSALNSLVECSRFVEKMLRFMELTFIELQQRLKMNLFVPTNLVCCASLSRLWFFMKLYLVALCECHHKLTAIAREYNLEKIPELSADVLKATSRGHTTLQDPSSCKSEVISIEGVVVQTACLKEELMSQRMRDFATPGKVEGTNVTAPVNQCRGDLDLDIPKLRVLKQPKSLEQPFTKHQHKLNHCRQPNGVLVQYRTCTGRQDYVLLRSRKIVSMLRGRVTGHKWLLTEVAVRHHRRPAPWVNSHHSLRLWWVGSNKRKMRIRSKRKRCLVKDCMSMSSVEKPTSQHSIRSMQNLFQEAITEAEVSSDNDGCAKQSRTVQRVKIEQDSAQRVNIDHKIIANIDDIENIFSVLDQ